MSDSVKNFISQFYLLIRRDFWILNFANISVGIALVVINPHALLQATAITFLFFKTISFVRNSNIMPSISADFDRFSWKYFQGLPLSKKELVKAFVITNFIVILPLLIWTLSFFGQISELFFDEKSYSLSNASLLILYSLPAIIILGLFSISNQITFPRKQYSKNDPKIVFYYSVTIFLAVSTLAIYGLLSFAWLESEYNLELFKKLSKFIPAISEDVKIWSGPFLLLVLSVVFYRHTLKTWQTEKIGYLKINWNPKLGFPAMAISLFMLMFPFQVGDFLVPAEFQGPLQKAVYKSQFEKVELLLSQGVNVNEVNKFGVAAIHIAAYNGNFKMFQYLENKGANIKMDIKGTKRFSSILHIAVQGSELKIVKHLVDQGVNVNSTNTIGSTPLHVAASACRPKILDYLISQGGKVNVSNSKLETPLHFASKSNCFSVVTALIEAEANPFSVDKKGKLALDYAKNSHDLAYYLEKKTRTPAGKITP